MQAKAVSPDSAGCAAAAAPRGPDFLGIGAARSGSTWLASNLAASAEVWLPHRKELHYFTREPRYHSTSFLSDPSPITRLLGLQPRHVRYRWELAKAFGRNLLHPSREQLAWDARFFFGRYDDAWYRSLFPPDKISGEITPAYALLEDEDVEALVQGLPHVRVIYILRDPVSRAWSTIRYHEARGAKGLTSGSEADVLAYLSQPGVVARSSYPEVIRRWRRFLPEGRFLVAYYDEVCSAPAELLRRILEFLGVDDVEEAVRKVSREKVNASTAQKLPASIEAYLSRQYLPMLEDLAGLVGGPYVESWLERARRAAA